MGAYLLFVYLTLAVYCNSHVYENWQKQYINDNFTLDTVIFPGTHDSGTYWLSHNIQMDSNNDPMVDFLIKISKKLDIPTWKIITPWATTQNVSLYDQAMNGIRYFDIRPSWNGTEWNVVHFEEGYPIKIILADLARFVKTHLDEIFIVELSHYYGHPHNSEYKLLVQYINDTLGDYLYPRGLTINITFGNMRMLRKNVILTFEDPYLPNITTMWHQSAIYNTYPNTDNLEKMLDYNTCQRNNFQKHKNNAYFFKVSWILTPQENTVVEGLIGLGSNSIFELSEKANKKLYDWSISSKQMSNILIADYFQTSRIVEVAIALINFDQH